MRVLFLGQLEGVWKSGWQRCQAMRELGHEVVPFAQDGYMTRASNSRITRSLNGKWFRDNVVARFNSELFRAAGEVQPEVVWAEWPMLLLPETVEQARRKWPRCRWVCYQHDNPFGKREGEKAYWKLFITAIPAFDLQLVKRDGDPALFRQHGARRAEVFMDGFYAPLFRPLGECNHMDGLRNDVSFVGTALDHRVAFLTTLLGKHRVPLRIYGNRWNRTLAYYRYRSRFAPSVLGEDYVRVINRSKINLGFVSSSNCDEYTMRTFEIPACRAFFLAERTPTHQRLFQEGREAEFFDSVEECADKIRFYIQHDAARERIAAAGYCRCLESRYSTHHRLRRALEFIVGMGDYHED